MNNTHLEPRQLRRLILEQSKRAHVGHIGSALSVADIFCALYSDVFQRNPSQLKERDRFVLAKGHAALALYATLFFKGIISQDQLNSYCGDNTFLGVHPAQEVPGIDFSTGSLGQGLSFGTGAALAARLDRSPRRVYVLLSDAECEEGSVWESIMFAAHHKLDNLIAVVDENSQQALGYTKDVINLAPLSARWQAFGWDVQEVDGHDVPAFRAALTRPSVGKPKVLIAHTVFGKGVSFMEGQIKWHYWPMSDDEFAQAMAEVEGSK